MEKYRKAIKTNKKKTDRRKNFTRMEAAGVLLNGFDRSICRLAEKMNNSIARGASCGQIERYSR